MGMAPPPPVPGQGPMVDQPFVVGPDPKGAEHPPEEHKGGHGAVLYMNLTPMIDMVFNLLFFFVMVAGDANSNVFLQSRLPKDRGLGAGAESPQQDIKITVLPSLNRDSIDESGMQIRINNDPESIQSYTTLTQKLQAFAAQGVALTTPVNIEPADQTLYVHVANAYNAAIKAGFTNVAFSIK